MSSSVMGPAVMPSGGDWDRVLYSWKRRLEAREAAIVFWGGGGRVGGVVEGWGEVEEVWRLSEGT